jgi:hypothetical protein
MLGTIPRLVLQCGIQVLFPGLVQGTQTYDLGIGADGCNTTVLNFSL